MKYILLIFAIFSSSFLLGQEYQSERKDDDYMPQNPEDKKFTPAYKYQQVKVITTVQVNTSQDGMNIANDAANEPSLAINPLNENEMVIGWRQFDNIQSNFRQAGVAYSEDGGHTWNNLPPIEAGIFRSDPVLATNSEGKFYYNSLFSDSQNGIFNCDVFSTNDLNDWSNKTYAHGGDKQWMVIDNTQLNSDGNIYANWKQVFSACEGDFTVSYDDGESYNDCSMIGEGPTRGSMSIDPDGILYNAGGIAGTHRVLRSISARDPSTETSWELSKDVDLKGSQALYDGPNPAGMLGQVWIATDHSEEETRGNVYLLSSVKRNDNSDPCDIMFSRSEDQGETWTEAVVINDDNWSLHWQWFGTMSVAPNGRIDVVWLDNRDFADSFVSALYYSSSFDGGDNWTPNEKISEGFHPHLGWPNQEKMGDYFHMISSNDFAFLAWAATFNGEQDVYFSRIEANEFFSSVSSVDDTQAITVFPNPFQNVLQIESLDALKTFTEVSIHDIKGRTLAVKNLEGKNKSIIDLSQMVAPLTSGVYLMKTTFENHAPQYTRIVKE